MLRGLFVFGLGVYVGIYAAQNYEVPKVDDPGKLVERLRDLAEKQLAEVKEKKKD